MMIQNLAIIIINRDLKNDTADCVDSILTAGADLKQIVVIDNGSKDGSIAFLSAKYGDNLNQIEAKENFGYPYGLNLGIKFFMDKGAKWFLLMNNDVIVAPDFLKELGKAVMEGASFALFGPMILYHSLPKTIWFMGAHRIIGTMLFTNDHRGMQDSTRFPNLIPVDFVHGCTMIVRRDVFEKIGLFDDSSPIYGDDVDFSWRARVAGFKMAAVPSAKMWHKVSAFMQRHKPNTRYLRIRNQIWFYRRYARGIQVPFLVLFTLLRSAWIAIGDLFHRQPELLSPLVNGWWDGWRGKGNRKYS